MTFHNVWVKETLKKPFKSENGNFKQTIFN